LKQLTEKGLAMKTIKILMISCLVSALSYTWSLQANKDSKKIAKPIEFRPAKEFNDSGSMVGHYYEQQQTATIHDPSIHQANGFSFHNVQQGGTNLPADYRLIGMYNPQNQRTKASKSKPNQQYHSVAFVNLYGKLDQ